MLNLMHNGQAIGTAIEGGWAKLPSGAMVSPAAAGWTDGTYSLVQAPETPIYVPPVGITAEMVNQERERRMRGTFSFIGKEFDCNQVSLQRITGAATLAGFWLASLGDPESVFWHGGTEPFAWIAHDNSINVMDAGTVFDFGKAAAANETAHIFAARALKDMTPIPENYTSDIYWP